MKWIVGLGNPGRQYERTRHNVGFMVIDLLAGNWGIQMKADAKCQAHIGEGHVQGEKVVLIKPQTYMNLSGQSARAYMDYYKASLQDLIVLYDDLDTPVGQLRLRYQGSAGGHNGIKSMIQHVGTQSFNRVRIGISRPPAGHEIVHYVLSDFAKSEHPDIIQALDRACEAVQAAVSEPFEKVMAKFNG